MEKATAAVLTPKNLTDFETIVKDEAHKIFGQLIDGINVADNIVKAFLNFRQEIDNYLAIVGKKP